jgi:hypothetical protein
MLEAAGVRLVVAELRQSRPRETAPGS